MSAALSQSASAQTTVIAPVDPTIVVFPGDGTAAQTSPPMLSGIIGGGTVELGQDVTLTVQFYDTGDPQTYQWKKNGNVIVGATNVSYALPAVTANDAGTYTATVTNSGGSSVATTDLTVKPLAAPVITTQPRSLVLYVGQTATFSFVATGSYPRTYRWRKDGVDISGATAATYSVAAVTAADAAGYSVVVSNSQGSATSSAASLTVNAAIAPVVYTGYPYDATATVGSSVSFSVYLSSGTTPITYQWYKSGVALAGATTSQLSFNAVTLSDADKYSVKVTNAAGSATSREAILTVNPATPITISSQPQGAILYEGQSLNMNVYLSAGTSPITYQWRKDGVAIAGATYSYYQINAVELKDSGNYSVVVTNPAGAVTSGAAVVVVNPAVAPAITSGPASQNLAYGGYLSLFVQASGTSPLQYQWKKDGVAISGATYGSYSVSNATPGNSGDYTVTVTNRAGSVTSNAATIKVAVAVLPIITTQPTAQQIALGMQASFSVNYTSTGAGSVSVKWQKDGIDIAGANSSYYTITAVKTADGGVYTAIITGVAGSVTSAGAKLTVLPAAAPSVSWGWGYTWANVGDYSASFSVYSVSGSPPFTYQWYKDGVAVPGGTNSSLSFSPVTVTDFATYTLTISNQGGVITSPPYRLRQSPYAATSEPWLDIGRVGDIVYFVGTSPSRIDRYDLANEQWLATTYLGDTRVPTAFYAASDGVYVAYGRALTKRSLDLSSETTLANVAANIAQMFVFNGYLYYTAPNSSWITYNSLNLATLAAGPNLATFVYSVNNRQFSFAASLRKGFIDSAGLSPGDIDYVTFNADGTLAASGDSPYHGTMPVGSRTFVFPGDQLVADNGGTVFYANDLTFAGSFGEAFTDLAFFDDGTPVVLRGTQLIAANKQTFVETGRVTASAGYRVYTRGTRAFVFGGVGANTPYALTKVSRSAIVASSALAPTTSPTGRYSVDDAYIGSDGTVFVLSRTLQGLIRWNPISQTFLSTQPLRGAPVAIYHQPGNGRLLISYADGVVTQFPLTQSGVESQLIGLGHTIRGMVDLGGMFTVNIADAQDSGDNRLIFGTPSGPKFISTNLYNGTGLAWQASTRRLYSTPAFSSGIQYEVITASGDLDRTSSAQTSGTVKSPIRFSSDGTLLATMDGHVFNANLDQVGVLANEIVDAAFLPTGLFTIRSANGATEIQSWAKTTYFLTASTTFDGTPVRIFRISDTQLLVITANAGTVGLVLVSPDLRLTFPGDVKTYAGVYFAKVGNNAGTVAFSARPTGTGALLANVTTPKATLVGASIEIKASGVFSGTVQDLSTGVTRDVSGTIGADGSIVGTIAGLNLTFAGNLVTGSNGSAGYYQAAALNGASGDAYAIIAPDGRAIVATKNGTGGDVAMATTDGAGRVSLTTVGGATFDLAADAGSGAFTLTGTSSSMKGMVFGALRDGVAHTERLVNISSRARTGAGDDVLTAGFVVSGSNSRTVLIRAVGPTLTDYGVSGVVSDPKLTLYRGKTQLLESDNWGTQIDADSIAQVAKGVGAFDLPRGSKDSALYVSLDPGAYSAQVSSVGSSGGVAMIEVYDAGQSSDGDAPRVINISTRGRAGVNDDSLIAGFVVGGNAPKRVLIRGVGPTLGAYGVSDTLGDPVLTVRAGQTVLATNDNWGSQSNSVTAQDISNAGSSTGAFPLASASKDAALLLTLLPGLYTAQVSSNGTTTGIAMVEVYEVSN